MEDFIAEVHSIHGDVRGGILHQLSDCCASGKQLSYSVLINVIVFLLQDI